MSFKYLLVNVVDPVKFFVKIDSQIFKVPCSFDVLVIMLDFQASFLSIRPEICNLVGLKLQVINFKPFFYFF